MKETYRNQDCCELKCSSAPRDYESDIKRLVDSNARKDEKIRTLEHELSKAKREIGILLEHILCHS